MNLPVTVPPASAITAAIETANGALVEARTNWERVKIRDQAEALKAAAAVMKRQDLVMLLSEIVADAERLIEQNTPRQQGQRTDIQKNQSDNFGHGMAEVAPRQLKEIRAAHSGLTDEQYEAVKQAARDRGQPLTRSLIGRASRAAQRREMPPVPPPAAPQPDGRERLLARIADLEAQVHDLHEQVADLEERLAIATESDSAKAVDARFQSQAEVIRVCRAQLNEMHNKHTAEIRRADYFQKRVKELER